jgi:membrane protease YdiL (CAAX protease family)
MALGRAGSLYAPLSAQCIPRYLLNPRHQPSEGGVAQTKSDRLSEASKAAVFSVMLLVLALAAALLIRALDPPQMLAYIIWGSTPLAAVLIMMFVITGDGRTQEGRALLGLHRLGVRLWWIAILGSFLISLLAAALTWATPFASFTTPANPIDTVLNFAVNAIVTIVTFAAAEEIAWRGTCCRGCCS